MYSTAHTADRPPQIARLPRIRPLSRLSGAMPTNAASCLWLSVPNSGRSATNVAVRTGPAPGIASRRSARSRHIGLARTKRSSARSACLRRTASQARCSSISARMLGETPRDGCAQPSASRPGNGTTTGSTRKRSREGWPWGRAPGLDAAGQAREAFAGGVDAVPPSQYTAISVHVRPSYLSGWRNAQPARSSPQWCECAAAGAGGVDAP
jgi:hypothetical protein